MEIQVSGKDIVITHLQDFCLRDILCCGQCFVFRELAPDTFFGTAGGRALTVSQSGDTLTLHNTTPTDFEGFWRGYFDLDRDYAAVKRALCCDETLRLAVAYAPGMRVLRQPPWEALCSFILSQNNNIKRIQGIVERLCETFGEALPGGGYGFPTPQTLASLTVEDLAPLRAGFRAKYILDAAQKVASGEVNLNELYTLDIDDARRSLMRIKGVGIKVADCALLYGASRVEAFPLDVWMKRAMASLFPKGLPDCAVPYAGLAQQYIFHYIRCGVKGACEVGAEGK
ncbi:DNA-3-methyladenine glycosylase family protein [Acetanaerobacterium elongatum]|uniref:DNA-(apurinic or apyrimidinic site) lyase n=1 Tax=Acetanaerobacterium elongatum TaxID=258515 RepID=A0A1H0CQ16_9FIRM|nr:DNA-3-methyladenine glycosylase [Acetanaerobacterium elongatum]SDN59974.1 N-glycosylase/DNA lyase [Acetanaerobacterium elongatum]